MINVPVSVIVTIYNAENTLQRCIDSLVGQTMVDFEAILVDDGSTDKSGQICDEYAMQDSRIRVFHKKNGGVSSARQYGIERAYGQYVIYVDSDDWVDARMLEKMYFLAKECKADVVVADFEKLLNNEVHVCVQPDVTSSEELLYAILEERAMGALWNKLILRSLFCGNPFDKDVFFCEDVLILTQILLKNELKVTNAHDALYRYVLCPTSITNSFSRKMFDNRFLFVDKIQRLLEHFQKNDDDLIVLMKMNVLIWMARSFLYSNRELEKKIDECCAMGVRKKMYCDEFEKRKSLLKKNMFRNRFRVVCKLKSFLR